MLLQIFVGRLRNFAVGLTKSKTFVKRRKLTFCIPSYLDFKTASAIVTFIAHSKRGNSLILKRDSSQLRK